VIGGGSGGGGGAGLGGSGSFSLGNSGTLTGGAGGAGTPTSYAGGFGGNGGNGGAGIAGGNFSLTNTGSIKGGAGGAGGASSGGTAGSGGSGGAGIQILTGSGASVYQKGGTISGGASDAGINGAGIQIDSGGSLTTLNNDGTIIAGVGAGTANYGIVNNGAITNLSNSQGGGTTAGLTYSGNLPTNYQGTISSALSYGQLAVTGGRGAISDFDVTSGSSLSYGATYAALITGVSAIEGETGAIFGTYVQDTSNYNWTLLNVGGDVWDLIVATFGSPATEFAAQTDVIRDTVTDNASSGLNSAISANQTMMQAAKGRFIAGANQNLALDVDGSLNVDGLNLSTMGTFYGQSVIGAGARRLIFGSFDIQRDGDTSTTTFSGKIAWEKALSDKTMMGFFIGAEVARSNLQGSFTGGQDHLGLSLGGYAVQELASQIYLDGFVSLGAGRNNLTMSDGVLDLDSDYATRSATFGASVSGVIAANGYEVLPELSLSIGRTWIEEMAFTGTAYGVIDNTLRQDASMVTLASLTFRPQIRMALDGEATAKSKHLLTFAPRLICQQATTTACGRGAEIGLQSQSSDGMTTAAIQVQSDLIDGRSSTTAQIKLEHRF
jgi:hypothetical protein